MCDCMFPMCSHQVSKLFPPNVPQVFDVFPKAFPIAPQFCPILLNYGTTSMYVSCKVGANKALTEHASTLGGLLCWKVPHVPNNIGEKNQTN